MHDKIHHIEPLFIIESFTECVHRRLDLPQERLCIFSPTESDYSFPERRIFVYLFSHFLRIAFSVEDVISYLKGSPEKHAECTELFESFPRGSCR